MLTWDGSGTAGSVISKSQSSSLFPLHRPLVRLFVLLLLLEVEAVAATCGRLGFRPVGLLVVDGLRFALLEFLLRLLSREV